MFYYLFQSWHSVRNILGNPVDEDTRQTFPKNRSYSYEEVRYHCRCCYRVDPDHGQRRVRSNHPGNPVANGAGCR
ncbi:hypothetical protein EMIT0196MI5_40034 [Pseudomonas sp. IT-196MI5]